MSCHLDPDFKTVKVFFFPFLSFVDPREATGEVLFDQAPATIYLHAQVYCGLALAAMGVAVKWEREEMPPPR